MTGIEGLGEAVEGTMVARAVEPDSGEQADGHTHEGNCLNCSTPLDGPYCKACGQRAHVHRTLGAFFHDLVHGVLHFEGKLWRTLPAVAFRPGRMTRAYIEGQRARYISPIALYLFVVFITFAAFSMMGGAVNFGNLEERYSVDLQIEQQQEGLDNLRKKRAELSAPPGAERDRVLKRMYRNRPVQFTDANREEYRLAAIAAIDRAIPLQEKLVADFRSLKEAGIKTAEFAEDPTSDFTVAGNFAVEQGDMSWFDAAWTKAKENPKLLAYKLQNTAYKFGWLMIPISAPLVWLLFVFGSRRYPLYDHTVFVTYSISVSLFLFLIAAILGKAGLQELTLIPMLAIPIHQAVHFWGTYKQRKRGFLLRLPLFYVFALIACGIFVMAITLMGMT